MKSFCYLTPAILILSLPLAPHLVHSCSTGRQRAPGTHPGETAAGRAPQGYPDLVKGLEATPRAVGRRARPSTASGKQWTFAWFREQGRPPPRPWDYKREQSGQGAKKNLHSLPVPPGFKIITRR